MLGDRDNGDLLTICPSVHLSITDDIEGGKG